MSTTALNRLKQLLKSQSYLLPKNDEYMCHTLPKHKDRLRALTNFSGSNGYVVIHTAKKSQFVTDSRYDLQAFKEVDSVEFDISTKATPMSKILSGCKVLADAKLFTVGQVKQLGDSVEILAGSVPLVD